MATKKDSGARLVDKLSEIYGPRERVAWLAAAQIEALLSTLQREAQEDGFDDVMPTLLRRLKELNSVVLSVTGDDDARGLDEMQEVVHG